MTVNTDISINKTKRNHSLDIARIIAVLAVVMIHCSSAFAKNYELYTGEFIFGNLFNSLSRLGVPLFLMISGALFLDERKNITIQSALTKYAKSIAVITVAWALFYSITYNVIFTLLGGGEISLKSTVIDILIGHYHMWYLYMIIGLYIITPFLKKFVCKENKNMVLFFIAVAFAANFLAPTIDKLLTEHFDIGFIGTFTEMFYLDFFGGYVTYFLTGWYIVHVGIDKKNVKYLVYALGAVSLCAMFIYVYFTGNYEIAYDNIGAPVYLYAVSLFLAVNSIKTDLKDKTARIIETLSKLTFGVYLIHVMILTLFNKFLPYSSSPYIYITVCYIAVLCCSFIGSYIISKIPLLKKLIKA